MKKYKKILLFLIVLSMSSWSGMSQVHAVPTLDITVAPDLFTSDTEHWCNLTKYKLSTYGNTDNPKTKGCEYYKNANPNITTANGDLLQGMSVSLVNDVAMNGNLVIEIGSCKGTFSFGSTGRVINYNDPAISNSLIKTLKKESTTNNYNLTITRLDDCLVEGKNYLQITSNISGVQGINYNTENRYIKIDNSTPLLKITGDLGSTETTSLNNCFIDGATTNDTNWKNYTLEGNIQSGDPFGENNSASCGCTGDECPGSLCGTAGGTTTSTQPNSTTLCSSGANASRSDSTAGDGVYNWACTKNGFTESCSAKREMECGTAADTIYSTPTLSENADLQYCKVSAPSTLDITDNTGTDGDFNWICKSGDGRTKECSAGKEMNGKCGPANKLVFNNANQVNSAGLCDGGTAVPSSVSGSGGTDKVWSWKCEGMDNTSTSDDVECSTLPEKCEDGIGKQKNIVFILDASFSMNTEIEVAIDDVPTLMGMDEDAHFGQEFTIKGKTIFQKNREDYQKIKIAKRLIADYITNIDNSTNISLLVYGPPTKRKDSDNNIRTSHGIVSGGPMSSMETNFSGLQNNLMNESHFSAITLNGYIRDISGFRTPWMTQDPKYPTYYKYSTLYNCDVSNPVEFDQISNNYHDIMETLSKIQPIGSTPIGDSLLKAKEILEPYLSDPNYDSKIILLTDGLNSCGTNPYFLGSSLGVKVDIISFMNKCEFIDDYYERMNCHYFSSVPEYDTALQKLRSISEDSGGDFYEAQNALSLAKSLESISKCEQKDVLGFSGVCGNINSQPYKNQNYNSTTYKSTMPTYEYNLFYTPRCSVGTYQNISNISWKCLGSDDSSNDDDVVCNVVNPVEPVCNDSSYSCDIGINFAHETRQLDYCENNGSGGSSSRSIEVSSWYCANDGVVKSCEKRTEGNKFPYDNECSGLSIPSLPGGPAQ